MPIKLLKHPSMIQQEEKGHIYNIYVTGENLTLPHIYTSFTHTLIEQVQYWSCLSSRFGPHLSLIKTLV